MFRYKRISLMTLKGFEEAEKLKEEGYRKTESGYKTIIGFNSITFEIPIKKKTKKK